MKALAFQVAFLLMGGALFAAEDLETTFQKLKEAEAAKDAAQVKKLAVDAICLAREAAGAPAPASEEEKESWKTRVEYAKTIGVHAEYSLYVTAMQAPPATLIDLVATLEAHAPKSKYLDEGYGSYFLALNKTGQTAKIIPAAEKALANFPENEDALLILAEHARSSNQNDRSLAYANRLVAVMGRHAKPEGLSAADWDRKRTTSLTHGHWIAGVVCGEKNLYADADKHLRAALPGIRGNEAMMAPALFYLGLANYNLGKMTLNKAKVLEGAKFSEEAAKLPGQYAQLAWKNAMIMKGEADKMR
jgi:tetratricopeptide (TPR) repeat protein